MYCVGIHRTMRIHEAYLLRERPNLLDVVVDGDDVVVSMAATYYGRLAYETPSPGAVLVLMDEREATVLSILLVTGRRIDTLLLHRSAKVKKAGNKGKKGGRAQVEELPKPLQLICRPVWDDPYPAFTEDLALRMVRSDIPPTDKRVMLPILPVTRALPRLPSEVKEAISSMEVQETSAEVEEEVLLFGERTGSVPREGKLGREGLALVFTRSVALGMHEARNALGLPNDSRVHWSGTFLRFGDHSADIGFIVSRGDVEVDRVLEEAESGYLSGASMEKVDGVQLILGTVHEGPLKRRDVDHLAELRGRVGRLFPYLDVGGAFIAPRRGDDVPHDPDIPVANPRMKRVWKEGTFLPMGAILSLFEPKRLGQIQPLSREERKGSGQKQRCRKCDSPMKRGPDGEFSCARCRHEIALY